MSDYGILLNGDTMNKNIVIFYVPGAMGSFVSWMIERFNTVRPDVINNPLTDNGSSHAYASLCSIETIDSVDAFVDNRTFPTWGYKIWAGWPVDDVHSIDECIQHTLSSMQSQDRLILITRNTPRECSIAWNNATAKLDADRWDSMKMNASMGTNSMRYNDPKFIEISINELLYSTPQRLLSILPLVGFDICDSELFADVLKQQRKTQPHVS
jgi:hypothetical protein